MIRPGGEQITKLLGRGFGAPQLEVGPGEAVERVGRERRRRVLADDLVVRRARLAEPLHAQERLGFPELRLHRLACRRQRAQAAEGLESGLGVAPGEPRAPEKENGRRDARVVGIFGGEALEAPVWNLALDHERRAMDVATLEPGAMAAVTGARRAGFATAVWTNNARELTLPALERLGLAGEFDLVVTRDDMRALKPDPDGWRVISEHFKRLMAGDAVVVGDSWVDGLA